MYNYRIRKYIGTYAAVLGGVDALVFTAGVGEHQWDVREGALEGLEFLGIELDKEKTRPTTARRKSSLPRQAA